MSEPVRVRDNVTGHEYSTYAVNEKGEVDEGLTVLDEDAVDVRGELLPPKYPALADPEGEQESNSEPPITTDTAVVAKKAAAPRTDTTGRKPNTEEN